MPLIELVITLVVVGIGLWLIIGKLFDKRKPAFVATAQHFEKQEEAWRAEFK